ncbi:MAG: oligosaccharide flippase family protein [Anaerolineae bacterium]
MRRHIADVSLMLALLLLPLLLFAPVTLGDRTLLPADILYTFEPFQSAPGAPSVEHPHNGLLGDLVLENYVWQCFIVRTVRNGQLPLWDPFIFAGHPFLANGQHSALYPLSLVFHLIPLPRAYGVFISLQLGLAGVGMYLLSRVLGANRLGAALAGITFQFSGFLVVSVVHPMIVAAAAWLPWQLAFVELTVRRAPLFGRGRAMLPWALLGAAALGLQVLAGHAEITYFSLLVMGTFAAWRLLHTLSTTPRKHRRHNVLSPALGLLLTLALGLGLGMVQLIPLYEVVRASFRQDAVTLQQVLGWAYPKRRLITFLVPNFFGNPAHHAFRDVFTGDIVRASLNAHGEPITAFDWGIKNYVEGGAYLGLLPLLLALLAVVRPLLGLKRGEEIKARLLRWLRDPYIPFFSGLALFSLGCIFGTPLYALVYALPLLNQSHSPFRWVFPLTAAVAVLAGQGATLVTRYRRRYPLASSPAAPSSRSRGILVRVLLFDAAPNAVSVLAVSAIWGGVLLLGGLWGSRLAFAQIEPFVERLFWSLAKAASAYPDHRAFYAYEFHQLQQAGLLLIATGIVLRVSRCPIYLPRLLGRRPAWELLAGLVLLVDLLSFGAGFHPQVDPALLSTTPPVVDFLRQDSGIWRFSTFDPHGRKIFNANSGMFFDFQDVRGYDSLFTAQYAHYMGWIEPQGQLPYNRIAPFTQFSSLDSPLTDLLNVKYIVTDVEIPLPKYKLVYQDETLRVYENLGVVSRAFTLPQSATLVVPDAAAVGKVIQTHDPRFYAIVEASDAGWSGPPPALVTSPPSPAAPAEPRSQPVVAYEINQVVVDATVEAPAWLILGDSYFPGWKAFVRPQGTGEGEEQEVPIARVAGNFRGVQLDAGAWTVRFRYTPNSVKYGGFVSFLSGMLLLFLAAVWTWRRFYREQESASVVQRIAKNSLAPILLTLFNRAIDLAFAALMLRILGPANAGDYYYAASVFVWFEILTNFGLDAYLTREVARHPERANRYLFNTILLRVSLVLLGVPLLVGFIFLRQTLIADLTAPAAPQALTALALLYVGLLPGTLAKGLTSLFYAYEKAEYPAALTTVSTLVNRGLGVLVLLMGWGILGLAGVSIVVNLITVSALSLLAARLFFRPRWAPSRSLQRAMVTESWPLMVNHLLATLFFKVDVVLIEALQGSFILGLYSTGYKLLEMLMVIPSMFTLAIFPVISRHAREDRERFRRFYRLGVKILVTLVLPVAVLSTLAAREMVLVLGGPQYLPDAMITLQLMAWSMPIGWVNSLTQYVLIALDQQRYLTRAYLFGFGFSLIANLVFIPLYGYRASAVIHIFAELALFVPFILGVRREIGALEWKEVISAPLLATLIMGAVAVPLYLLLGRGWALLGAALAYPLAAWRLGFLSEAERAMLAPLFRRN